MMLPASTIAAIQDRSDTHPSSEQGARAGHYQDPDEVRICLHECDFPNEDGCPINQLEPCLGRCALERWKWTHTKASTRHANSVPDGYLTVVQVAHRVTRTKGTIHRRLSAGQYPGAYQDEHGQWFIPKEEVQ